VILPCASFFFARPAISDRFRAALTAEAEQERKAPGWALTPFYSGSERPSSL
jgi:hypothetical protein